MGPAICVLRVRALIVCTATRRCVHHVRGTREDPLFLLFFKFQGVALHVPFDSLGHFDVRFADSVHPLLERKHV